MKKLIYLIAALAVLGACNTDKTKNSPSGKYTYTVLVDAEGEPAKEGDVIITHIIGKDHKDSVWFDNDPMVIRMDTAKWKAGEHGLFEILDGASEGDSLMAVISTQLFFEESVGMPVPPEADSVPQFTFYVKVKKITDMEGYNAYMTEMMAEKSKKQNELDFALMDTFAAENGLNVQKTDDGIYYVITQPGEGENAQSGQTVVVNYSGYLLNKVYFDTSLEEVAKANEIYMEGRPYEPFDFIIDESSVIAGWHQGFKQLNKGAKATLIIPSSLGYGPNPMGMIPPNSVLVFDVEVIDIQ